MIKDRLRRVIGAQPLNSDIKSEYKSKYLSFDNRSYQKNNKAAMGLKTIENLPEEVLLKIFEKLDPASILNSTLVSKR